MIHIELSAIPDIVAASIHSASMKAQVKRTANTWQQRTEFEQFSDLFPGDLAKNVVYEYLTRTLGLQIANYDHVRTDGWANADPYDLKIENATIEVKSSIEKDLPSIEQVQRQRRVIIYAHLQQINDYMFQVHYIGENESQSFCKDWEQMRGTQLQQRYGVKTLDDLAELFCTKVQRAHIMGFADRPMAEQYLRERRFFSYGRKTGRESQRDYLNLFIRDCYSPETFTARAKVVQA